MSPATVLVSGSGFVIGKMLRDLMGCQGVSVQCRGGSCFRGGLEWRRLRHSGGRCHFGWIAIHVRRSGR